MSRPLIDPEAIAVPDITHLVTEDDTPVDNFQSEKQQRLLVEPLYSSSVLMSPFIAAANVGIFYAIKQDPVVPDVFLSLGVQMPIDWSQKQNRSYFVWEFGKVPEVVIEIVSNRVGKELTGKKTLYSRMGIPYYAVFDPLEQLQGKEEMARSLLKIFALSAGRYSEQTNGWLETVGLGLKLWEGEFEGQPGIWLRWCQETGEVVPTGKERAERLAERLKALGINPDEI